MIFIKNIDNHFVFSLFGITLRIKLKNKNYKKYKKEVKEFGLNNEERNPKIIVSLTTFPDRINSVYNTINCLLNQTMKPDKLVLYLASSQFPKKEEDLPNSLLNLKKYGLTISWCDDIKSYKKLLPALKDYPNDIIITFDDDIYYDNDVIEKLYLSYQKNKDCIYTHRASRAYFDKNGKLKLYKANKLFQSYKKFKKPSLFNSIIGFGGVLYPPNSLYKDVLDIEKAKELSYSQDDIWFYAMAVLQGTKICLVDGYDRSYNTVENTQQFGLCKQNNQKSAGLSGNDALDNIVKKYPSIITKLKEELEK